MQFPRSGLICAILVASSACVVLVKVSASISDNQPFTAVETLSARSADRPMPEAFAQILAVTDDGHLVARLVLSYLTGPAVYHRTVWNRREKTEISIDPDAKMLVVYPYREDDHLTAGPNCDGAPDGQIEGFDVYRTESKVGDPTNPGGTTTERRWAAPKLGCFVLRDETLTTDKSGKVILSYIRTLTDVKIGEPDPSYFDTSLPKGYSQVLPDDWENEYINRKKAQRAKQGQ